MKKLLLSLCLMATLGSFLLNAEEIVSIDTKFFEKLRIYLYYQPTGKTQIDIRNQPKQR